MSLFKLVRIVALLSVLVVVLLSTWMDERRLAGWERPVWVTVYPMVTDDNPAVQAHAESIESSTFAGVNRFFERELSLYDLTLTPPFNFQIAPVSNAVPPAIPDGKSMFAVAVWSLKMRWWIWRMQRNDGLFAADIQLFVFYHDVGANNEMTISVGMRKGKYGLAKAYIGNDLQEQNNVVIAHELLHVFGATDKYLNANGDPEFPSGYAYPEQQPLYPQAWAEIMGGRIPLSPFESIMPTSLDQCRIGHKTAEEIGFLAQLQKH